MTAVYCGYMRIMRTTKTQKMELCSAQGTARKRTSSRLRRTNDRNVSSIHEDHEDEENAENGVVQRSLRGRLL